MGLHHQDTKCKTPIKLSFSSLPSQPPEPPGLQTPPLRTSASVPFRWEEAPGKPRSQQQLETATLQSDSMTKGLELPPRLYYYNNNNSKSTKVPSPITVLDGPYKGRKLPRALSFSRGKGAVRSFDEGGVGRGHVEEEDWRFRSSRWGSFEESTRKEWRGSFDFSYSVGAESDFSKGRMARVRKRRSFFGSAKSQTWANFYESIKQVVHWRRRQ